MEYIPAIHTITVGARYYAFIAGQLSYGLAINLDLRRRHSPPPPAFLYFDRTVSAEVAMTLREKESAEVVIISVDRQSGTIFTSLPADPVWLTWNNETVRHLARRIRATGEVVLMPVLADALEEAGCTDATLLDYCRRPADEERFWAVDLLATQE